MACKLLASIILQTVFIIAFIAILTPFRFSIKKTGIFLCIVTTLVCVFTCRLTVRNGAFFMVQYGFLLMSLPLFPAFYFLSKVRGIRFTFIFLTSMVFNQILSVLLMVLRIYEGGFTFFYFFMIFVSFGLLLSGGYFLRTDSQKIVFTSNYAFQCLSPLLLLLLAIVCLFSPIIGENDVDADLLLITLIMDLLIVLIYLYIVVSFHGLSKHCDKVWETVSLQYQLEEAKNKNALLQVSQENGVLYRHDLRHHLFLIQKFLEENELVQLREYLSEAQKELENSTAKCFCQNETVNLLLDAFYTKAHNAGIRLHMDTQVPNSLPIGNTELCTLLSNALENAITAVVEITDEENKTIRLMVKLSEGKLLIFVENNYSGEVRIENGLPRTNREGHGFGVKSIEAIVKKQEGLYTFDAENGIFTLRIVI